eukprot:393205_1
MVDAISQLISILIILPTINTQARYRGSLLCNEKITDVFYNTDQWGHYYQLYIDNIYDVTFDDCSSVIDIMLFVANELQNIISTEYCNSRSGFEHDECGRCDNYNDVAENFTIPNMIQNLYYVFIYPFEFSYQSGTYQLTVTCSEKQPKNVLNESTSFPITTDPPDSTITYTTSVQSDINATCEYYQTGTYLTFPEQQILHGINIKNPNMEISFDIKLHQYCHETLCNIFYVTNMDGSKYFELFINGISD